MIDLGSANIDNVEELFLLIFVTIWLWAPVVYISFIFCIIAFEEKIDLENIPNHEKIREIVETNREKKSDRNLLTSDEREFLNENWEEISARIGKNNIKYINRFYGGGKLNWSSGFFGGFWLLYRGMLEGFVTFTISLLGGSFFILFFEGKIFETIIIIIIIICLLFARLGDYYYFKSLQKRVVQQKLGMVTTKLGMIRIMINVIFITSLVGGSFFVLILEDNIFETMIIIIICLLFAMLGNYYYSKEKAVHPDIKLSFIIVNLLFQPMILLSWFMFMVGGGLSGFGID